MHLNHVFLKKRMTHSLFFQHLFFYKHTMLYLYQSLEGVFYLLFCIRTIFLLQKILREIYYQLILPFELKLGEALNAGLIHL